MQAKIWGCRGSLAAPGPETVKYGGNTSCVEVRPDEGPLIILDAGSGIQRLGLALGGQATTVHLFLTHLHLDHLLGLGFFSPLWNPELDLHIWGPPSPVHSVEERIARYMSPPLFPVHLFDIPTRPTFHNAPTEAWEIGSARVQAQPVTHRGPTVGYRIEDGGQTMTYIPDHEPALGVDLTDVEPEWVSGYSLAAGTDVLLHDAQYTSEEYSGRIGWGHSSVEHVVEFARLSGAKQLVMFHHDPLHSDDQLNEMLELAQKLWGSTGNPPVLAHEDMAIDFEHAPI